MAKVSIIIPAFNCEAYVEDCIRSVTNQSEREIEIIVVDDGSTDRTASILEGLARQDQRISIYRQPNSGYPGVTRNHGLKHATGRFIAFLDGDDLYHPEKVRNIVSVFDARPDVDIVFHDLRRFERHPDDPGPASFLANARFTELAAGYLHKAGDDVYVCDKRIYKFASLEMIPFHTSAIAIRKHILSSESAWFPENMRAGEDGDLWLRLAKNFQFAFVNEVLSYYRQHQGSVTADTVQYLLGAVQIHKDNLERGRDLFTEHEAGLYRSKIARLLSDLGYAYSLRFNLRDARHAYSESLRTDFRRKTIFAYLKTFAPQSVVSRYRQRA